MKNEFVATLSEEYLNDHTWEHRQGFEQSFDRDFTRGSDGDYLDSDVQLLWLGYEAGTLHAAEQMAKHQWQPIESAPRDGTSVLVACSHGLYSVAWEDHNIEWWHVDDNKHGPYPLRGSGPTHWMPLPPAPEKGGAA